MKKNNKKVTLKKRKSQKIWNMKGCSRKIFFSHKKSKKNRLRKYTKTQKGGCGCDLVQAGGDCGCNMIPQAGGLNTHVGSSWTPSISGWPGVSGVHDGSWLAKNNYPVDPQTNGTINERNIQYDFNKSTGNYSPKIGGGKGKKSRSLRGGFFPALTNTFRNLSYGVGSAYNTLGGYNAPVNPLPYEDQLKSNTLTLRELSTK